MVFSAPLFLFAFLPLFLIVYYPLPKAGKLAWILVGSWVFYAMWRADFLVLLAGVSFLNWGAGILIVRSREAGTHWDKAVVTAAVCVNLAVLGYFKYANFGIESMNGLLSALGLGTVGAASVILPVGISFYIFQALSYTVDVYRGDAPAARSFTTLAAYIALFPQLIAGPIVRYKDIAEQLGEPHIAAGRSTRGVRRFIAGLAKKVLIADTIAPLVASAFSLAEPSAADAWIGATAYAVQLYFDFAAYSDMAIGLGLMLGFRFRENFRQPYRARSITEFWKRWHISLSTWLRDYLYIPLGGNRISKPRTYLNLFLVMLLGGLWHGAAWNFIVWGAWHGLWLLVERRFIGLIPAAAGTGIGTGAQARAAAATGTGDRTPAAGTAAGTGAPAAALTSVAASTAAGTGPALPTGARAAGAPAGTRAAEAVRSAVNRIRTLLVVLIGWVFFRADGTAAAFAYLKGMTGAFGTGISPAYGRHVDPLALTALAAGILFVVLERRTPTAARPFRVLREPTAARPLRVHREPTSVRTIRVRRALGTAAAAALLILSITKLVADSYSPFLYFRF